MKKYLWIFKELQTEFVILVELPVDTSGTISLSMGDEAYQGFTATFNEDGTGFTIAPTIPKKVYKTLNWKFH